MLLRLIFIWCTCTCTIIYCNDICITAMIMMITMISTYQIYIYIYEFQNINKDIQKLLKSKSPVHFNGVNLHKYEDFLSKAKRFLQHFINLEEPYLVQVYVLFRRRKHQTYIPRTLILHIYGIKIWSCMQCIIDYILKYPPSHTLEEFRSWITFN